MKRKVYKPHVTPTSNKSDFGHKLWFKPDKSTQRLSDAKSKSREFNFAEKQFSHRSKTVTQE